MIQPQTYLNICDNTGFKKIMFIKILGNNNKFANIGDIFIGVIKKSKLKKINKKSDSEVNESKIVRAIIVRTKNIIRRKDGNYVRFDDNACIVIKQDNTPIGTKIFGPIAREIKDKNFIKVASIAEYII